MRNDDWKEGLVIVACFLGSVALLAVAGLSDGGTSGTSRRLGQHVPAAK